MFTTVTAFIATIAIAAIAGIVMKLLRQPLIIGYIIAGIIAGPVGLALLGHGELFELFSTLGVSSLLFLVGLGINPQYIRNVGPVAIITGLGQIFFTSLFGCILAFVLGFDLVPALYLSVAFTFSSTIVVLRLLQEKDEEDSLYGRISIGLLLVQDLAAMVIFLFISSTVSSSGWGMLLLAIVLKLVLIALIAVFFVRWVLPKVEALIADNRELLLLSSFSFCLVSAWAFSALGFSFELGALSAGVMLSWSRVFREIASRIEPMRDFFLVLFFAVVGSNITFSGIAEIWLPVVAFSLFILIGNPLIVYFIMVKMGYTSKTSFFTGLTVAQISEFSLIMMALGMKMGHISADILTIGTIVGLITIAGSSYLMLYNESLYAWIKPVLRILTPSAKKREPNLFEPSAPFQVLLIGAHRLGGGILEQLHEESIPYMVVDFDPHLVKTLQQSRVNVRFGSADDSVFLDSLDMTRLKLVISTIPQFQVNAFLIDYLRARGVKASVVCVSHRVEQARDLYTLGADYVVMPPYLGRRFVVDLFKKNLFAHNKYVGEKKRHLRDLEYLHD